MTVFYPNKDTNNVLLSGVIKEELEFVTEFKGTKIYKTILGVFRLSGLEDILPIYISDRLDGFKDILVGKYVKIDGSMRSSQYRDSDRVKRTRVYVQVKDVLDIQDCLPEDWYDNSIELSGKLFRDPILRKSKSDKKVDLSEIVLEVHRGYNKYDHIPAIVWGTDAKYISKFKKGTKVSLDGRFQSRNFIRHKDSGLESAISYEVSVRNIEILEERGN